MVGLPAARGQLGKSPATKVSKAQAFESPQACEVQADPQALEPPPNAIANQLHQITNSKGSQCTLISESAPSCSVSVDPTHRGLMSGAVEHFGCTLDKLQKLIKSNTFKFGDQRCPQPASELLSQHGQWTSLDCSTIVSGILCVRESLHTPILNLLHHPR